jgi:signal transduction histidine kinase
MQLGVLEKQRLNDGGRATLKNIRDTLREAAEATRSLTVELSPPVLHDAGLAAAPPEFRSAGAGVNRGRTGLSIGTVMNW